MWLLATRVGAAIGGAFSVAVAATVLWSFFHNTTPKTLEEANRQLERIADSIEKLSPEDADAATVQALQQSAVKVAEASFGSTGNITEIVKVTEGVFDLAEGDVYDIRFPDGGVLPMVLAAGGQVWSVNRLVIGGVAYELNVGDEAEVSQGAAACRLLFVHKVNHNTSRFRWRCGGF